MKRKFKLLTPFLFLMIISCKGVSQEKEVANTSEKEIKPVYKVQKSEAQWREDLTDLQFYILRKAGTETAGTSELLSNKEEGIYVCAGCATPVFESQYKYNSGTGWPSFDREVEGNVAYDVDYKIGVKRIEEHCATCGGHLGHVFEDGPRETTGLRHCINGAALKFIPSSP
ncbi:peptide-methionine (R)-S-oxide reductase MsrB [Eudoraea chungangensis]|uniref:peptide-methionine (R)-S-oxide reductase MsrB n=1 Tax=Eudoraea chungangensis TaxID=1481905 RepID=UPI0023EDAC04|nr:peptide-methionine (R)-S-oxide reductase MsrB [Eudoraea chungangensis]